MNRQDEQHIVTVVLRGVGILVVLIGLILTTQTILGLIAASSARSNLPAGMNIDIKGTLGKMGAWAIVARLSISVWGAVLYALAQTIAAALISEAPVGPSSAAGAP